MTRRRSWGAAWGISVRSCGLACEQFLLLRPVNLTEQESGLGFFWHGGFTFGEAFVDHGKDYPAFRHKAIAWLKS